ncbi:MAG TPA: peptidylprolyl isomerase [Bryobacteraceae bacterium]|nr:peptidylprolyl isomerase [Bryobacteraceae bacterium]
MRRLTLWLLLAVATILTGCSSEKSKGGNTEEPKRAKPTQAPNQYFVRFETSEGPFVVEVNRQWAPRAADRFFELVNAGFFDGSRFFRVRPKFIVQFGISKDPQMNSMWSQLRLPDDPVTQKNRRGYLSFATRGPGTRTTQIFLNLVDNASLDGRGFAPFGRVVDGIDAVEKFYSAYGEIQNLGGGGPDPSRLEAMGDEYAQRSYPSLDKIEKASVVEYTPAATPQPLTNRSPKKH